MITEVLIKTLKEDSTIQTLLGASDESSCPIVTTYNFENTIVKQINVGYARGTTEPWDKNVHDGTVSIHILVKDTEDSPIDTINSIAERVLEILDLAGTTLSTEDTVYWVQKIDDDWNHYEDMHFYEYTLVFRFVTEL